MRARRYLSLVIGLIVGVVAAWVAMSSIQEAPLPLYPEGAAALGYTKSLILFVIPVTAMGLWFLFPAHHENRHWFPFLATVIGITIVWTVLDVLLAHTFFTFPDPDATTGIAIPGVGGEVPIEEVLFYVLGSLYLVLAYIWTSEVWFQDRDQPDADYAGRWNGWLRLIDPSYLIAGAAAVGMAIVVKEFGLFGADPSGFPWYFVFLIAFIAIPAAMLFGFEFRFINLPAFLVTVMSIIIIGILWEVTLALPYGWWNYQRSSMIGIFITPWSNLPVEAAFLWVAAAWSNVAAYELLRVFYHRKPRPPRP